MKHPEQEEGERFLGNFTKSDYQSKIAWRTKRMGATAYYAKGKNEGKPLPPFLPRLYPIFAKVEEIEK